MDRLIGVLEQLQVYVLAVAIPVLVLAVLWELLAMAWPRLPRHNGVLGVIFIAIGFIVLPELIQLIFTL